MNKTFKLIINKFGEFIAVSELAKGYRISKKTALCSAFTALLLLATAHATNIFDLQGDFNSSAFIYDPSTKKVIGDKDISNNKKMMASFTENTHITFGKIQVKKVDASIKFTSQNIDSLIDNNYIQFFNKDGTKFDTTALPYPTWESLVFSRTKEITWLTPDGQERTLNVHELVTDTETGGNIGTPSYSYSLVSEQPNIPFYDLAFASIDSGIMYLDDTKNSLDLNFGGIKNSSLFRAEKNGSIHVGSSSDINPVKIKMTFDAANSITSSFENEDLEENGTIKNTIYFGPNKSYAGDISVQALVFEDYETGEVYTGKFTINTIEELQYYQDSIIAAIRLNLIPAQQYDLYFNKAFKNLAVNPENAEYYAEFEYSIDKQKEFYVSSAMKEPTGDISILKSDGVNSSIVINKNTQISAVNGYILYGTNGSTNTNHAQINILNRMGNVLIRNGATYTNEGTLVFGYKSLDGVVDNGDTNRYNHLSDQVTNGHYINNNKIFISNNGAPAIIIRENGSFTNNKSGEIYIASTDAKSVSGNTARNNGINLQSGTWDNKGTIYLGKGITKDGALITTNIGAPNNSDVLSLGIANTHNVIAAISSSTKSIINHKDASIIIGDAIADTCTTSCKYITKAVGINSESTANTNIKNFGSISVGGLHTVGIRTVGDLNNVNSSSEIINDGIIDVIGTNSIGMLAENGATLVHNGIINVQDSSKSPVFQRYGNYGIKAIGSTAHVNGAINLNGNASIGVLAYMGGQIHIDKDASITSASDKTNQIFYWVSGRGLHNNSVQNSVTSSIIFATDTVDIQVNNKQSTIFRVDKTAELNTNFNSAQQYKFTVAGEKSTGIYAADAGTTVKTNDAVELLITGKEATGLLITSGAGTDTRILKGEVQLAADTKLTVSGENASAMVIDGKTYDIHGNVMSNIAAKRTVATSDAKLSFQNVTSAETKGAVGYKILDKAELNHSGSINFVGENVLNPGNATAIYLNGGTLNNSNDANIIVNGIGVDIYGRNSIVKNLGTVTADNGIAAVRLNEGASLAINGNTNSGAIAGHREADAIRVHSGATLSTVSAQLSIDGTGAGIHFLNMDSDINPENNKFTLSGSGTISVKGNDATGILVEGQDANKKPTMGMSHLYASGSKLVINVEDKGGNGIVTNTSGDVYSGINVNILSEEGQSALIIKGETKNITQSGILTSNSKTSAVVELKDIKCDDIITFTNSGTINKPQNNGTIQQPIAVNVGNDKDIKFINSNGANISGTVSLGNKTNEVILYGNSTGDIFAAPDSVNTTIILRDVSKDNSGKLFNQLIAGNGSNDAIEVDSSNNSISYFALSQSQSDGIKNFEKFRVHKNSTLELDHSDITLNETATNKGGLHLLDTSSSLFINQDNSIGGFTFNHYLYGIGTVKTDINGKTFSFNSNKADHIGQDFTGTLWLEKATYTLMDHDTKALAKATLKIGQQSHVTVKENSGIQNIGGLAFSGGTLFIEDQLPDINHNGQLSDGSIHVNTLDLQNATGTIAITADTITNTPHIPSTDDKLLIEHDYGVESIQIVAADAVIGASTGGLNLDIYDRDGNMYDKTISETIIDIEQNGHNVAKAIYNYGLQNRENSSSTNADGIYVSYKLTELELLEQGDNAFVLYARKDAKGHDADFSAKLTGSGDLIVSTPSNYISLSNSSNDYTGKTTVKNAHLYLEDDNVLGQTSLLTINAGSSTSLFGKQGNFKGTQQTIGALALHQNGSVDLGETGHLTVKGDTDSVIAGSIKGQTNSTLTFNDNKTTINHANINLESTVELKNSALVEAHSAQALGINGAISIAVDAVLKIGDSLANSILNKDFSGNGLLSITTGLKDGATTDSSIILSGTNTEFKGNINIGQASDTASTRLTVLNQDNLGQTQTIHLEKRSVLNFDNTDDEKSPWVITQSLVGTGSLEKNGSGYIQLTENSAQYTGSTKIVSGTIIAGTEDNKLKLNSELLSIQNDGRFIGHGEITGSVINEGQFHVGKVEKNIDDSSATYIVNGNFTNKGQGVINLNVKYPEADKFQSVQHGNIGNQLIIKGNYIADAGSIIINTVLNKGFSETSTDSIVISGNAYKQGASTRLYIQNYGGLGAATEVDAIKVISVNGISGNDVFVLGSPATIGLYEYTLHKGQKDNHWYLYSNPDYPVYNQSGQKNINPRVGGYLSNAAIALEMFNTSLHDRLGNSDYGQSMLNPNTDGFSSWGRIATVHRNYRAADNKLSISGDYYVAQMGTDLIKVAAENDGSYRFGMMFSYGSSDFTTRSRTTGSKSDNKIDQALSVGLYGTWYQPESWFVDGWIQHSQFKNEISMHGQSSSKYNSNLWNVSIEVGYNHKIGLSNGNHLILQPNAQAIYGHLASKNYLDESSGLFVQANSQNNINTRIGMKLFYVSKIDQQQSFRPYIEANWLHNSTNIAANFNNRLKISSHAPKNIYEVKVGAEGALSSDWSVWGNVGYQKSKQKYKGYKATLGVKYTW